MHHFGHKTAPGLSAEAHAKVHEAAASLGYRPNVAARALRTDKSRLIAFISDYVATTRFASGLIRGALAAAEEAKHVMLVLETGGEPAREIPAVEAALDRQVDGLIFAAMRARSFCARPAHQCAHRHAQRHQCAFSRFGAA